MLQVEGSCICLALWDKVCRAIATSVYLCGTVSVCAEPLWLGANPRPISTAVLRFEEQGVLLQP